MNTPLYSVNTGTDVSTLTDSITDGDHGLSLAVGSGFGLSVALNGAGDMLAIGGNAINSTGAAYNFEVNTGTGVVAKKASLENGYVYPLVADFGHATAFNSAGDIMAVSVYGDNTSDGNGAIYIYDIDTTSPTNVTNYEQSINSSTAGLTIAANESFGASVALNDTGDALAIGATGTADGTQRGAVYLMNLNTASLSTAPTFRFQLDDQLAGLTLTEHDSFGYSVALNGAADLLFVGDPYDSTNGADAGAIHSFSLNGTLTPTHLASTRHITAGRLFI